MVWVNPGVAVVQWDGLSTWAIQGAANTCYDNGNVAGAKQQYSVEMNGGAGVNCALRFKMQAGD